MFYDGPQLNSNNVDVYLTSPSGINVIDQNYNSNAGPVTLPVTGSYSLDIANYVATSESYSFQLFDSAAPVTPLTLGTPVTGTLVNPGDQAAYTFTGTAGERLYYDGTANSGNIDVYLEGPSGERLISANVDTQSGPFGLPEAGTYTLVVYGNGATTGSYGFDLRQSAQPITPLTLGNPVTGTIASPGDQAAYTFTGTAGERLYYDGTANSGNIDVYLEGPSGERLISANVDTQSGPFGLPEAGTYNLVVYGNGATTGSYGFDLRQPAVPVTPLTLGNPFTGTIASPGDQAAYTFTGTAGERLYYDGTANSGNIDVYLEGPSGERLISANVDTQSGPFGLPEAGTYNLVVYGNGATTGSYGFDLRQPAVPVTPLTLGNPVTGTISGPGDQAVYPFTGTAGERLYYDGTANSGNIDVYLEGPSGERLISANVDTQSGPFGLPEAGTYNLVVYGNGATTGSYGFDLRQPALPVTPLTLGNPVTSTLANPGDQAVYTFAGSAGERITYDALVSSSAQLNVLFRSPSADQLLNQNANNDAGFTLPEDGTYTLTIYGNGAATGSYGFQLIDASSLPVAPFATTVSGTLNPGLSEALYQIVGSAGQTLYFQALGTDSNGRWNLYSPGPSPSYVNGAAIDADFQVTLPQSGSYYLVLNGQQSSGASVNYSFQVTTPTPVTKPLSLGATIQGSISQFGETITYSFLGRTGQRLVYNALQSGSPNVRAVLTSPSGLSVFNINIDQNDGPFTLAEAGIYTLTLEPGLGTAGPYAFQLEDISTAPALTLATTISGTLTPGLSNSLFQFSGTAGQRLDFQSLATATGTWALYDPANVEVASNSLSSDFVANLSIAGTYLLVVQGNGASGPANYQFQVTDVSDMPVAPTGFGIVQSGTIAAAQTVLYDFTAPAGLPIYFNGQGAASDLVAVLNDPAGNNVFYVSAGSDSGPYILQRSGTYALTIEGNSTSATGSYQFQMIDLADDSTPLALATPASGTLSPGLQAVSFSLSVPVGDQIDYDALTTASTGVRAALYSADGTDVFYTDANNDQAPGPLVQGNYFLIIEGTQSSGSYDFQILDASAAPALTLDGTPVTGTLSPGVAATLYTVQGNAGDLDYFHSVANPGSGSWYLYGPGGQTIASAGLGSDLTATLPSTGTYILALYGGNTSGPSTYDFIANVANIVSEPIPTNADPTGPTTYTYDPTFNVVTNETDPLGHQTLYQIDPTNGNVMTMTQVVGSGGSNNLVTQYTYDAHGLVTKVIDPNGIETDYAYNQYERLITITYAVGTADQASQHFQYDAAGNQTSFTDENGKTTTYAYNVMNELTSTTDPLGNTTSYTYDAAGDLLTTTDALGHITTDGYDVDGNVIKETDANGGVTSYTYDAVNNLTSETDPLGNLTRFGYDARDRLTTTTDAAGGVTRQVYDRNNNVIAVIDPLGNRTQYVYDILNRLTREIDPLGDATVYNYDADGNLVTQTDALGNITTYAYDDLNQLITETDSLGDKTTLAYDADGNLIATTDPLGKTTTSTYDARGLLISTTDPLGNKTQYAYDPAGNLISSTDPLGNKTLYAYDADDDLTKVTDALGGITTYTYDAVGDLTSSTDPLGQKTTYAYDALGNQTAVTDPLGNTTKYTYDADGNQTAVTDPLGHVTKTVYDSLGRPIEEIDANSGTQTLAYDADSNLISTTDPLRRTTQFAYDALGDLTATIDPLGNTTVFAYDAVGNQISVTDPLGRATGYTYDALGRAIETTDPLGETTTNGYDADGNLTSVTDPLGNTTKNTYDADGNLTSSTDALGAKETYTYDADGNLIAQTDRDGRTSQFAYDALGNETSETWLDSSGKPIETMNFTYDADSQLKAASDPNSSYQLGYDAAGNLTSVSNKGTPGVPTVAFTYAYDAAGNNTSAVDSINGVTKATTAYSYNALNRVTRITQSGNGVAPKRVDFSYDAAGDITSLTRYANLAGTNSVATTTTSFDAAGNLTGLTTTHGSTVLAADTWKYDPASEITQFTSSDGTLNYAYDADGQLISAVPAGTGTTSSYSYDANGNPAASGAVMGPDNELLYDGTYNYTYDADGNLISQTDIATGDVTDYQYDYRNRLTAAISKNAAGTVTQEVDYTYDVFDRLIGRTVNIPGSAPVVERFVYDGDNIALTFDGSGNQTNRFLYGPAVDQVLADEDVQGNVLWMLADNIGTIRDVVDSNGTVVNHISYDPFGQVTGETNPGIGDTFGFAGMVNDSATGLDYDEARFYDPATERFVSQDPIGLASGDANFYRYVGNDPTNLVDPSGLTPSVCLKPLTPMLDKRKPPKRPLYKGSTSSNHYLGNPNTGNPGTGNPNTGNPNTGNPNTGNPNEGGGPGDDNPIDNGGGLPLYPGAAQPAGNALRGYIREGRITGLPFHVGPPMRHDNASAQQNLHDISSGRPMQTSHYGNAPVGNGPVTPNPRLVDTLTRLGRDFHFRITEIAGGSHSPRSRHYTGDAFDVDRINGMPVNRQTINSPTFQQFRRIAEAMGARVLGPGFPGHDTHFHFEFGR